MLARAMLRLADWLAPARCSARWIVGGGLCLAVAGCGTSLDNPLSRRTNWFAFVGGTDLQATCQPGQPDRIRLVYNGTWRGMQRIIAITGGRHPVLEEKTLGGMTVSRFSLGEAGEWWRGVDQSRPLTAQHYNDIRTALAQDHLTTPPSRSVRLDSDEYYWTGAACLDGRFTLTAWRYPDQAFQTLHFPTVIDLILPPAQPTPPPEPPNLAEFDRNARERWTLEIGPNGLVRP